MLWWRREVNPDDTLVFVDARVVVEAQSLLGVKNSDGFGVADCEDLSAVICFAFKGGVGA